MPPALAGGFLTTAPPGKPNNYFLIVSLFKFLTFCSSEIFCANFLQSIKMLFILITEFPGAPLDFAPEVSVLLTLPWPRSQGWEAAEQRSLVLSVTRAPALLPRSPCSTAPMASGATPAEGL